MPTSDIGVSPGQPGEVPRRARRAGRRRLVVNADDFGRSLAINEAVERAHREGILTTASLMTGGAAFDDAVQRAGRLPQLGVGLHLTVACGLAVSDPRQIPALANASGHFGDSPAAVGFRYWAKAHLRPQLKTEILTQFERFRTTGLVIDHVNGHLHFHLHPVVFGILMELAPSLPFRAMRLTRDSFAQSCRTLRGRWLYRLSHALIFGVLSRRARPWLDRRGIRYTDQVFGMLADGRADEAYLLSCLPRLPDGDSEFFSHPSLDASRHELDGLTSARVRRLVGELGIQLARYQDL